MSRGRDVDEGSSRCIEDETLYLAELVAGKSKVKLQQYTDTQRTVIAAIRASTVEKN